MQMSGPAPESGALQETCRTGGPRDRLPTITMTAEPNLNVVQAELMQRYWEAGVPAS